MINVPVGAAHIPALALRVGVAIADGGLGGFGETRLLQMIAPPINGYTRQNVRRSGTKSARAVVESRSGVNVFL